MMFTTNDEDVLLRLSAMDKNGNQELRIALEVPSRESQSTSLFYFKIARGNSITLSIGRGICPAKQETVTMTRNSKND